MPHKTNYTSNVTHLAKTALRNGGYEKDSNDLQKAEFSSITLRGSPCLSLFCYFGETTGFIYLSQDKEGVWTAEY